MYSFYVILTLLIIFLLSWFIIYDRFIMTKSHQGEKLKHIYKDDIKTGDIIIMDFQGLRSFLLASFFKNNYLHPVMAFWKEEELFIFEFIHYSDKKGLMIIPYEEWKYRNKNSICKLSRLEVKSGNDFEFRKNIANKVEKYYEKYKELLREPSSFDLSWKRFWFKQDKKNYLLNQLNCNEMLVMFLIYCDILPSTYSLHDFVPNNFANLESINFKEPYMYKEKFLFNL